LNKLEQQNGHEDVAIDRGKDSTFGSFQTTDDQPVFYSIRVTVACPVP
jgi:hypothetical protein